MPIRVLLAEDHQIVRQSLRLLLERASFTVVGEAADGHHAVSLAGSLQPDVAVLDITMPALNGLDAAREIRRLSPRTRIIILTVHDELPYLLEALRVGVRGYIFKTHAAEDLIQAIREASRGGLFLSPEVSRAAVQAYQDGVALPADPLSPRERQVLQLIAEGNTTRQLAARLGISVKTAETHRSRLMEKLDVHETAGLVRYAVRRGLVQA